MAKCKALTGSAVKGLNIRLDKRRNGQRTRYVTDVATLHAVEVLCIVLVTADVAALSSSSSDERMWTTSVQQITVFYLQVYQPVTD